MGGSVDGGGGWEVVGVGVDGEVWVMGLGGEGGGGWRGVSGDGW